MSKSSGRRVGAIAEGYFPAECTGPASELISCETALKTTIVFPVQS